MKDTFVVSTSLGSHFKEEIALALVSAEDRPSESIQAAEMNLLGPRASPKRRAEFLLGRLAANLALGRLTPHPPPVLRGMKGEPLWPEGVTGSIAHCESWAVALVARSSIARMVGVDMESCAVVQGADVAEIVCCREELDWVTQNRAYRDRLTMLFSAKECVFKAFYPVCGRFIDFNDVQLSWCPEHGLFDGRFLTSVNSDLGRDYRFEVECERIGNFVFSFILASTEAEVSSHQPSSLTLGLRSHLRRSRHRLLEAS